MSGPIKTGGATCETTLYIVNPGDSDWTSHRYVLAFGAYGRTRLLVWANNLDDAFDEAIDWIADHKPGLLELVMACVSMKPGDTDDDYFASYTPAQLAWATTHGEALSCEAQARYCDENGDVKS